MNSKCSLKALSSALLLACASLAQAATVPAGVKLHDSQELVRRSAGERDPEQPGDPAT